MPKPHVVALIQARLTSSRLPGKVLAKIGPWSIVELMSSRLKRSKSIDQIVYVVPNSSENDTLADYLKIEMSASVVRGDEHDVLGRFMLATESYPADYYVRLTADCPFVCPELVDEVVRTAITKQASYVSNTHPPSYADGFDVECISAEALRWTNEHATDKISREHVTIGFYSSSMRPKTFTLQNISFSGPSCDWMRLTVDTAADLSACNKLFEYFGDKLPEQDHLALQKAYQTLKLSAINGHETRNSGLTLNS
jgi:spore coat polysaccharide biosynthesis protein SpsF (cytidylyltransferase family)